MRTRRVMRVVICFLLLAGGAWCQQQLVISTVAGGAPVPTPIAAANASIVPTALVADSSGNVYIASVNAIYKMPSTGTLTRIAGTGRAGFSGDGGPATSAQIYTPAAMTLDRAGNLYFISYLRIRKIAVDGTISTLAGSDQAVSGGDGGRASAATFANPQGIAVDSSGNIYVSDPGAVVVRKIASNGTISTYAGTGAAGFSGDGGPAISARLYGPLGLAVDPSGNLYIADADNNRIRQVTPSGTISTIAGD